MKLPRSISGINFNRASLVALIALAGILTIGSLFWRGMFWDAFLWKYFAGPVYADAEDESIDGISKGYNPVNTLCYGLILAWAVYWIYRLFKEKMVNVDVRFALSVVPYILLGSVLRVLEDAEFFSGPIVYLMISPFIYIVLGLFTLVMVYLSISYSELLRKKRWKMAERFIWCTALVLFLGYTILYLGFRGNFIHIEHPVPVLGLAGILALSLRHLLELEKERKQGGDPPSGLYYLAGIGCLLFILAFYHLSWWGCHHGSDLKMHVIPGIILLTLSAWLLTLGLVRLLKRKFDLPFKTGFKSMNSLMILSQFLDGAATFTGIDFYGYQEKHVLPGLLIDLTGTAAVMFILKFLILLFAIYLLDVEYRKEMMKNPNMRELIKLVVIVLGLAPGTRDMLRLAFGT